MTLGRQGGNVCVKYLFIGFNLGKGFWGRRQAGFDILHWLCSTLNFHTLIGLPLKPTEDSQGTELLWQQVN